MDRGTWREEKGMAKVAAFITCSFAAFKSQATNRQGGEGMPQLVGGQEQAMTPQEQHRQMVRAVVASTVGTSIEWYDYFLYGTMAALVFPSLFFPKSSAITGTLNSFAIFFIGFAARPVGAWFLRHLGD